MKLLIFLSLLSFVSLGVSAQGTLQFNQALVVTDQLQTVPAGKVWKVTAIYGKDEVCRSVAPLYNNWFSKALVAGFFLNGVEVLSFRKFLTQTMYSNSPTCSSNSNSGYNFSSLNFESDPNVLPIWIPAGATVQTSGPNIFLSAIEFNIIP
jgi:hypothetical protein